MRRLGRPSGEMRCSAHFVQNCWWVQQQEQQQQQDCDKHLKYDRIATPLQTLHRRQQNTAMWDTLGSCMSDDTPML